MKKRSGVELKRSFKFNSRICLAIVYVLIATVYLVIGLQPANAEGYEVASQVIIPSIGLESDVTRTQIIDNSLVTPELTVGSYSRTENKTLLVGHSTTVFAELWKIARGDEIIYDGRRYEVTQVELLRKARVKMNQILGRAEVETLVLMTCAGEIYEDGDATHRLIITARAID